MDPEIPDNIRIVHSRLNKDRLKKPFSFIIKHKFSLSSLIILIAIVWVALWYRSYFLSKIKPIAQDTSDIFYNATKSKVEPTITPSPTSNVLGTQSSSNSFDDSAPTPFPTFPPIPTLAPIDTSTYTTTSSTSNSSTNSNCSTGSGVANAWYSDVYPNPLITASNGSANLTVAIRDCTKNVASVNDQLTISLSSGDSNTQVNGNNLPYSINATNGQANFTVTSQVSGTVVLVVHDQTAGFDITNISNSNPSISFSGSGGTSGNSNCSTANGTPNSWYSDVYPPSSIQTGSSGTVNVNIRDCGQSDVSSDSLTISQTSNDSSLTVNGSSLPVTISVQNGTASFTVSSQNAGTDTLLIKDTTSNFTVTDAGNSNPTITFTGSSITPTPTPNVTPTPTPDDSDTITPVPTGS
jgi:hypothetical protein